LRMERSIKTGPLLTRLGRSGASPYQLLNFSCCRADFSANVKFLEK
jgi:hypothetical protein